MPVLIGPVRRACCASRGEQEQPHPRSQRRSACVESSCPRAGGPEKPSSFQERTVRKILTRLRPFQSLQERLAKLVGGVAVINVGAATETEMKEKKARVEDAMHATRAAVEEGIVPGEGVAYLRCLHALEKLEVSGGEKFGVDLVRRALEEPLRWIVANGGWKAPSSSTKCARARPHSASTRRAASTRTCSRPGVID